LNQSRADLGIPDESRLLELGISLFQPHHELACKLIERLWNLAGHDAAIGLALDEMLRTLETNAGHWHTYIGLHSAFRTGQFGRV